MNDWLKSISSERKEGAKKWLSAQLEQNADIKVEEMCNKIYGMNGGNKV